MSDDRRLSIAERDDAKQLGNLLLRFARAHAALNAAAPQQVAGLSAQQAEAIIFLLEHDGAMVKSLAEALTISEPRASRLVEALVGAGHIVRAVDTRDRRRMRLHVAPATRRLADALFRERSQALFTALQGLTGDERQAFASLLGRVVEEFERLATRAAAAKRR